MMRQDLLLIRYPAEDERDRHLDEQSHSRKSITLQARKTEALDNGGTVGIKATEGPIVPKSDENVDPKQRVR